ncbi:1-aminocyclopropane-1-carboxylate deaminase/D-cysteine desulfhydrase [Parabacteroides goldsteinii]|uniref:1-aminocyclopropane-1-carboxylate deaminase/D-cysteine desulfhydrase n=1 Tax=Parabacteroides goldsteinii TaxID=328812 RepID=UPI003AB7F938
MLILEDFVLGEIPLKIVRDDLFPGIGGGNKSRKAVEYEKDIERVGANALVTTGGIQSNHCRAIALLAARKGWKCHIVYHGTLERFEKEKGNALLVRMAGASVEFVDSSQIAEAMDLAMSSFKKQGLIPYYVTGGGHDIPGGIAYVKAMKNLKEQCEKVQWIPDYIFLASGTGSTQCGIVVGSKLIGWEDVKTIGISVARNKQKGLVCMRSFLKNLSEYYNINQDLSDKIYFSDSFLCGGYESYTSEMSDFLKNIALEKGLILDTTYSGKACWGMMNIIKEMSLVGNILFWHTGGLMNIQK